MRKTLHALCSIIILTFISCSSDNGENSESESQKKVLNISDAKSLVVIEQSTTNKSLANETNLFKVLSDGTFVPLNFTNEDGSGATAPIVSTVQNLNSAYILLSGVFNISDKKYTSILVRKSDGAIYDASSINFSFGSRKLGEILPKNDSEGNIYYYKGYNSIGKLSLNNPDDINVLDYLPSGQSAMAFEVDSKGNCMYQYDISNGNDKYGIRIRKANGGIYEVKVEGKYNREFWLGNNGNFYFITYTFDNGYKPQINKINIDGDNISTTMVWSVKGNAPYADVGEMFRTSNQGSYLIKKEKSIVFIDTYYNWGVMNWEFFEDDNSIKPINLPHIEQGAKIVTSKENYYIATKTELYKVNLNTHEYTKLLNSGEYEVYTLNVDNNDTVQFSALRLKDGKKIFAEISKEGELKNVNEEINKKAVSLERIDK